MKKITSGGYGKIFKLKCPKLKKTIIMKQITCYDNLNEITVLKKFKKSPYICDYYSYQINKQTGALEIMMPMYNQTYRELVHGVSMPKLLDYWWQIAQGINLLHQEGIIHRDLKPENIFYDQTRDCCVIGDFGLVALERAQYQSKQMCTITYRAPEICVEKRYGTQSDIWSLAWVFAISWTKNNRDCFHKINSLNDLIDYYQDFGKFHKYKNGITLFIKYISDLHVMPVMSIGVEKLLYDMTFLNPLNRFNIHNVIQAILRLKNHSTINRFIFTH